jgi:hypothetical protein
MIEEKSILPMGINHPPILKISGKYWKKLINWDPSNAG